MSASSSPLSEPPPLSSNDLNNSDSESQPSSRVPTPIHSTSQSQSDYEQIPQQRKPKKATKRKVESSESESDSNESFDDSVETRKSIRNDKTKVKSHKPDSSTKDKSDSIKSRDRLVSKNIKEKPDDSNKREKSKTPFNSTSKPNVTTTATSTTNTATKKPLNKRPHNESPLTPLTSGTSTPSLNFQKKPKTSAMDISDLFKMTEKGTDVKAVQSAKKAQDDKNKAEEKNVRLQRVQYKKQLSNTLVSSNYKVFKIFFYLNLNRNQIQCMISCMIEMS